MPYAAIRRAHTLLTCCKSLLVVSRDRPSCTNIASASAQRVDSNTFVRVCRKFRFFTFEVSYLVLDRLTLALLIKPAFVKGVICLSWYLG